MSLGASKLGEPMDYKERRKIKLISRTFQIQLIIKFILINAILLCVFGILLYVFLKSEVGSNLSSAHVTYQTVYQMLSPIILTISILNIVFISVVISFVVLYSSHKIAGPLYRFNEALKQIAAKNLKTITTVRDQDQLTEISASLTAVKDRFAVDLSTMKKQSQELLEQLSKDPQLAHLHEKTAELAAILDGYST